MVLEKTLESPLDCEEIDWRSNQATLNDAGIDQRQEEKGTTEDEMVGWRH